jgi:hypothetical protein
MWLPLQITDSAILSYLEGVLLHPDIVAEALRRLTEPNPDDGGAGAAARPY